MSELDRLSHSEKVLLAGSIRAVIVAGGISEEAELSDLDRITSSLDFRDYEQCLDEFEEKYPDEESFLEAASQVTNPAAQELILKAVYDMSIQNGAPDEEQEGIFTTLSKLWEKR